jgi:hypothetical protein
MQSALIALCLREGGATSADLYAYTGTTSTKGVPWRDLVVIAARRFNYALSVRTAADRRVHYCFAPIDAEPKGLVGITEEQRSEAHAAEAAAQALAAEYGKRYVSQADPSDMRIR